MQLNPGRIFCLFSSNESRCSAVISEDQVYNVNITFMNSTSAIYRFNCEFLLLIPIIYCATQVQMHMGIIIICLHSFRL